MAVEYKTTMTKAELLELAIVNGIDVDDGMTKATIISAIDARNAQETAENATEGAQSGTGSDDEAGEDNNTTPDEKAAESAAEGEAGGYDLFVYAGPTLPRGRLKENAVFRGTFEDVKAYLADVLEEYPQVARLIVPVNRLAAFSVKVKTPGNLAHKYYSDIVSAMHGNKEV